MADLSFLTPHELETLLILLTGRRSKSVVSEFFVNERTVPLYLDYLSLKIASSPRLWTRRQTSPPAGGEQINELPGKWT